MNATTHEDAEQVWLVGPPTSAPPPHEPRPGARIEWLDAGQLTDRLELAGGPPAVIIFDAPGGVPAGLAEVRRRDEFNLTRIFIRPTDDPVPPFDLDALDVESALDRDVDAMVEKGLRAYRSLKSAAAPMPRNFLDVALNDVVDWFEGSRWPWSEVPNLADARADLLEPGEVDVIREALIAELGTLPGTHNFLREFANEYSFSYWATLWGAEETRHPLLLARYLRAIGVEVAAKHALYKRQPYPMGSTPAATFMMNVISESRASTFYRSLSRRTRDPVLSKIWALLSRDEARHARAFFAFCQERCAHDERSVVSAVEMAYVWLADRQQGMKHPSGLFFPHSSSQDGFHVIERFINQDGIDVTTMGDDPVLAMLRKLTRDDSLRAPRDLKRWLRQRL